MAFMHPKNPLGENRGVRELLESLAMEDSKDEKVIKGHAPPRIRSLADMADQIASEHGIAHPSPSKKSADEMFEGAPLKDLARILKSFTYGTMMQLNRELQAMPIDATSQGSMAALLHAWAMKTLGIPIPSVSQPQPPAPQESPLPPIQLITPPASEVTPPHPDQVDDPNLPPA